MATHSTYQTSWLFALFLIYLKITKCQYTIDYISNITFRFWAEIFQKRHWGQLEFICIYKINRQLIRDLTLFTNIPVVMLSSNCSEKASVCGTESLLSNKASLTQLLHFYIRTYKKYPNHKHELLKLPFPITSAGKGFP